jgi:aryl-alcohol dehydrogenase-like predicted oxidoreductase
MNDKPLPAAQQMLYNMLYRNPEENGLLQTCVNAGIGITAYCPLAMGVLTGKYTNGLLNGRLEDWPQYYKERFGNEQARMAAIEYKKIAVKYQLPLHHLALAWLLKQDIKGIIVGVSKIEQFVDNLGCMNIHLTNDIMNDINSVHNIIGNTVIGI